MAAEEPQALAKVNSVMMLGTAEEVKRDLELIMKPYANWEEFLTPGPVSIAILGELIFISAAEAFQVKLCTAGSPVRFLRHPGSFHACLMQVSDQGWKAFNKAHKNMDQIRLYTLAAPKHLASAVQVLAREPKVVKAMLPSRLNSLRKVAEQCQGLAASVEEEFATLIDLVQELLEVCASSRTEYHDRMEEVKRTLEESKVRKAAAEKEKKRLEAQFTETCVRMEEAHALYQKAVKTIPSGKNLVGVYVTQSLLDLTNSLATELVTMGITEPVSLALEVTDVATQHFKKKLQNKKAAGSQDPQAEADKGHVSWASICLKAMDMMMASALLQDLVSDSGTVDPGRLGTSSSDCKAMFQSSMEQVELEQECKAKSATLELCQGGISVCERLEEIGQCEKPTEAQLQSLATAIQEQNAKVQGYLSDMRKSSNTPAIAPQPPNLSSIAKVEKVQEGLSKMVLEQACFKVEQAKCQLDISRENYQKVSENKDKMTKDLDEVLLTMMRCQVKEIDYDTTLKLLVTGLGALSQVKEQWAKMSNFFQMMSNLIKVSLNDAVTQFASDSEGCELIPGYSQDSFVKDMIYTEAFQACSVASLCHLIAGTYVEVSEKHLRNQVTGLETNINLSPSDPMFNVKRTKLQEGYIVAKEAVKELVLKNKEEFETQIQQRIDHINSTLQEVVPLAVKQ
ncbi:uncharacterized protein LOC127568669 [Pristis pectinata]|uniref:uncharacterized protein LOC127568669 n=1 Tax=Pristis pectinata TaxID=685728 RepID=UPI00223DD78F|nr:uncharacterized protein LOC127568669 [Pristis pectinata]XP_051868639.1 uncharacterized protein LOC127568669 [Pristis pectinata]